MRLQCTVMVALHTPGCCGMHPRDLLSCVLLLVQLQYSLPCSLTAGYDLVSLLVQPQASSRVLSHYLALYVSLTLQGMAVTYHREW